MSAAAAPDESVPQYTSKAGRVVPDAHKLAFTFDGDDFVLIRPKLLTAISMMDLAESPTPRSTAGIGRDLARLLLGLLQYVEAQEPELPYLTDENGEILFDGEGEDAVPRKNPNAGKPRGRALLMARLDDPEDPFDLPDLEPVFRDLAGLIFKRPTGAPREPSPPPGASSASSDSEESTPSTPEETSGTSKATSSSRSSKTGSTKGSRTGPKAAVN